MNEVRSWDGWATESVNMSPRVSGHQNSTYNLPVRVVAWPEGAPKQEDVPHAGEQLIWGNSSRRVTVVSGIPVFVMDNWGVAVISGDRTCHFAWFKSLRPIPEPEPRTYTEDEIREVLGTAVWDVTKDAIIKRLRGEQES